MHHVMPNAQRPSRAPAGLPGPSSGPATKQLRIVLTGNGRILRFLSLLLHRRSDGPPCPSSPPPYPSRVFCKRATSHPTYALGEGKNLRGGVWNRSKPRSNFTLPLDSCCPDTNHSPVQLLPSSSRGGGMAAEPVSQLRLLFLHGWPLSYQSPASWTLQNVLLWIKHANTAPEVRQFHLALEAQVSWLGIAAGSNCSQPIFEKHCLALPQ